MDFSSPCTGVTDRGASLTIRFRLLGVHCIEQRGLVPDYTAMHELLSDGTERCDLQDALVGGNCRESCGLNTHDSPISKARLEGR